MKRVEEFEVWEKSKRKEMQFIRFSRALNDHLNAC